MASCVQSLKRATMTALLRSEPRHCRNFKFLTHNLKISEDLNFFRRFAQNRTVKCWQCGVERKNIGELFCERCNFIQTPNDKNNYFKVFELKEKFDVDLKQLTQKYRQMQSLLHPDKFSNKSDEEKNISEEFSSLVNKGYDVLQTPLKRAIHLLRIKGERIEEDQRVEDPGFLMEIMELNEEVEGADSPEKLVKLNRKNKQKLEEIAAIIQEAFEEGKVTKAKENIIRMKYYDSVSTHINGLMRERGVVE